jgi:hypothetical protein
VTLVEPVHTVKVMAQHALQVIMILAGQERIQNATRVAQQTILQAAVEAGADQDAPMKLAILQNEMAQGEFC